MPYQEFKENWKNFSNLISKVSNTQNDQVDTLVKRYIEQNILILNDAFATNIDNLKQLENAKSANDIICTQAKFTHELNRKLSLSAQRFLNASLGHITDYNEWLKAHCDLATD